MSHTPGPWFDTDDGRIIEGDGFLVAEFCDGISDDDARLIAAAPELLALLKELKASHYGAAVREEYEGRVEAAIAKAEGTA